MKITCCKFYGLSVFYSPRQCHQLLTQLLAPAFKQLLKEGVIGCFYFHLSQEQGSHVKISMFSDADGQTLTLKVENTVAKFLNNFPSRNVKEEFPKKTIFRNFENNTFAWDIFSQHPISTPNISMTNLADIRYVISMLICSHFERKPLRSDDLFSFSIQLQVLACRVIFGQKRTAIRDVHIQVDKMLYVLSLQQRKLVEAASEHLIKHSEKELNRLSKSVWSEEWQKTQHSEFHNWIRVCSNLELRSQYRSNAFMDICGIIMEHINLPSRQLNFISVVTASKLLFN